MPDNEDAWPLSRPGSDELLDWIRHNVAHDTHILGRGYQGHVHLYQGHGRKLAIKTAEGRGPLAWLRRRMLRHEYAVYRRLNSANYRHAPRCHGLLAGRHLVIEYVQSIPLRRMRPQDPARFFDLLFEAISGLHALGLAHSDLKRRDNILIVGHDTPCLIDFGTAVIRKPGFAPLNHLLFRIARQFDYNAWLKHKYRGHRDTPAPEDLAFYRETLSERLARALKRPYMRLRRWLGPPR